ncbi:unnamed protein product [Closterium sp. NIES-54]
MFSRHLVSCFPPYFHSVPPSLAPSCAPCIEGRLRATPHSSLLSATTPFQTLHLGVWIPSFAMGPGGESFFLLVVDDFFRYTSVFPQLKKSDVTSTLVPWLLATSATHGSRVLCLHSNRGVLFCYTPPRSLPLSLTTSSHPITNYYRTAHLVVSCVLPSLVTDTTASPSSVSALVATYYDFAATRRLDYATRMVAARPLSTRSESAIGCDILEDRQFELEFLAAVSPHLCAVLLAPEGDPHAFDMPTPRTYREAVSGQSTWSSSVAQSIAEAVISANAIAAQELRRLTFLLTDLGERPRSAPPLFADNKAMILLCQEPRLEGRVEHNVVMYFLLRELQRHGQTNLDFVASAANTTDIFTKALPPGDHHRFCLHLGLVQVGPRLLYAFGGVSSMRAGAVKGPAIGVVVGVAFAAAGVVSAVADVVSAAADVVSACRIVANALVLSASGMVYKLSARAIPCVFLSFVPDAPGWQFYHPTSRRVLPFQDVTFDESIPFYRLFPYHFSPSPPPPLFLAPGPPPVDPLPPQGPAPSGVSEVDPLPGTAPASMDAEMASWKSTGTYVDEVPPPGVNIVNGMWIFRVNWPPGSPPAFKARYVARGFNQRQGVDYFQTFSPTPKMTTLRVLLHVAAQRDYKLHSLDFSTAFLQGSLHGEIWLRRPPSFTGSFPTGTQWSLRRPVYGLRQAPREWHDTLKTTLAALGFVPSTADPSLFLRTDTSLPPFYVLVYVEDLVFATADSKALTLVKSELQKRHTFTDLGELRRYLGLQITWDRARRTITQTQSHMVHQVLQRVGFQYSSPQLTPLTTSHLLSAPPSDESVEPSGPYPELVGCLMYLMTCTRPDLAYPLNLLACYVAPGRHQKQSSQGNTFSQGFGSVSWQSTHSSSVLSSSCEAEIYAGAMAALELRWLTYLLTDLGEQPCSSPVLYVDNKAMIALCQEHRLEHRTKHIVLRYFLARELQQRGQLQLAYVATRANIADVFTKALPPGDLQRFDTVLGLVPTMPHLLTA